MTIIDGKLVSTAVLKEVSKQVERLKEENLEPCLAVIIVGNDSASRVYVNNKKRRCAEVGIKSLEFALDENVSQKKLLELIGELNGNSDIDGILCQLPLPAHIDESAVIEAISPKKDVDCFCNVNVGKLWTGKTDFLPCTPAGIIKLLEAYEIDVCGKNCVIVGRSNIVGKPLAAMLLQKNATVTVCHSKTNNLSKICRSADIIISAVGKEKFITEDMVKNDATVIDVGINRNKDGKLCGDVDFENVSKKASFITPVPGGCGPMTIAVLMENTVKACEIHHKGV